MNITVLGSGSKGNCYLVHNDNECLIIEAGMPYESILHQLGPKRIRNVVGCIVTHEHMDHAKYVKELLDHAIQVYATPGTTQVLLDRGCSRVMKPQSFPFFPGQTSMFRVGGFSIIPFQVEHDAADPCGYYIYHPQMGSLLFITDTYGVNQRFDRPNHILIECNHDPARLWHRSDIPERVKCRILDNHTCLTRCIDELHNQDLKNVRTIMLIHISEADGDPELFTRLVTESTGLTAMAAKPGLTIEANLYPF